MTDSQFKAFLRLLLDDLREINEETNQEKRDAKMAKTLDTLQKAIED